MYCLEPPTSLGGLARFSLSLAFFLAIGLDGKKARQLRLLRGARLRQAMQAKQAKQAKTVSEYRMGKKTPK